MAQIQVHKQPMAPCPHNGSGTLSRRYDRCSKITAVLPCPCDDLMPNRDHVESTVANGERHDGSRSKGGVPKNDVALNPRYRLMAVPFERIDRLIRDRILIFGVRQFLAQEVVGWENQASEMVEL